VGGKRPGWQATCHRSKRRDGADLDLPVLEELRQAHALRTGKSQIDLAGDTAREQGQVLRPADARDEEVQVMNLRRIDLDERTRQEVRLLLVVTPPKRRRRLVRDARGSGLEPGSNETTCCL
jgi:hypothetical protein